MRNARVWRARTHTHTYIHTHTHTHTHTQVLRILEDEGKAALLQVAGGEISGVKFVAV